MNRGFSLVEMTVSVAIVLALTGGIFALMDPVHGPFRTQQELMDEQQRLRVAAETVTRELLLAGAGTGGSFAPVLPLRRGMLAPDPPGAVFDSRSSVLYVPPGAPHTVLDQPTDGGSTLFVRQQSGFAPDMLAVIFDASGSFDTFRIEAVQDQPPALVMTGGALSKIYAPGTGVARVICSTFWIRSDAASGTSHLMRYDGSLTDAPVADDIEEIRFTYFGLAGGGGSALVELAPQLLGDGPWRPDATAPNRFDADLLRVRRVRVAVRARGGRSVVFDVTLRNPGLQP